MKVEEDVNERDIEVFDSWNQQKERSTYPYNYINDTRSTGYLIVINDDQILSKTKAIYKQYIEDTNSTIPFAKNYQQAVRFLKQVSRSNFDLKVLADLEFLEELTSNEKNKRWLENILDIQVFINSQQQNQQDQKKFYQLKERFPSKIKSIVYSVDSLLNRLRFELNNYRTFYEKGQNIVSQQSRWKIVHVVYFYLGSRLTQKKGLNLSIKAKEYRYSPLDSDKSQVTDFSVYMEACRKLVTQKSYRSQRKDYLSDFEFIVRKLYSEDEWELEKFNNYVKQIDHENFNPSNQKYEEYLTKILAFYRLESFVYKTMNSLIRLSSKVQDFRSIALPLSQLQQSIKHFHKKYQEEHNYKVEEFTVYRACLMPKNKHLQKGMYLYFKGPQSFTTDQKKAQAFYDKLITHQSKCILELKVPNSQKYLNEHTIQDEPGYVVYNYFFKNDKTFRNVILSNPTKKPKEQNSQKLKQQGEKELKDIFDENQVLIGDGCIVRIMQTKNEDGIFKIVLQYGVIYDLEENFKNDPNSLNTQEQSIVLNYQMLKKMKKMTFDEADMYMHAQDYVQCEKILRQKYQKNPDSNNTIRLIQVQQLKGNYKDSYEANMQLINKIYSNLNSILRDQTLKQRFRRILVSNQETLKLREMLRVQIEILRQQNTNQMQIAWVLYEQAEILFSERIFKGCGLSLNQSQKIAKESLEHLNNQSRFWMSISNKIRDTQSTQASSQTIEPDMSRQKLNCLQLLMRVKSLMVKLYESQGLMFQVRQERKELGYLMEQYNKSLGDRDRKPLQIQLINVETMISSNNYQNAQEVIQGLREQLDTLCLSDPYSLKVEILSKNVARLGKSQLKSAIDSSNSHFVNDIINQDQIGLFNDFKSLTGGCCIWNLFKSYRSFNYQEKEKEVQKVSETYEILIKNQVHNKGENHIDCLNSRVQYSEFSQENSNIDKSIEQALLVLKSQLSQVHTTGCKAHLLLSQNFFEKGEYRKSSEYLQTAKRILGRVKLKQNSQTYKENLQSSELNIELSLIQAKLELKKVNIYIDRVIKMSLQENSYNPPEINTILTEKKQHAQRLRQNLRNLRKVSQCSQKRDVTNYIKIRGIEIKIDSVLYSISNQLNPRQKSPTKTKDPEYYINQASKVGRLIRKLKGNNNMDLAINYSNITKLFLLEKVSVYQLLRNIRSAQKSIRSAFEIASAFPFNHPKNYVFFFFKFEVEHQAKLLKNQNCSPTLLKYAVDLSKKNFKEPNISSLNLLVVQCKTLIQCKDYKGAKSKLEQLKRTLQESAVYVKQQSQNAQTITRSILTSQRNKLPPVESQRNKLPPVETKIPPLKQRLNQQFQKQWSDEKVVIMQKVNELIQKIDKENISLSEYIPPLVDSLQQITQTKF